MEVVEYEPVMLDVAEGAAVEVDAVRNVVIRKIGVFWTTHVFETGDDKSVKGLIAGLPWSRNCNLMHVVLILGQVGRACVQNPPVLRIA